MSISMLMFNLQGGFAVLHDKIRRFLLETRHYWFVKNHKWIVLLNLMKFNRHLAWNWTLNNFGVSFGFASFYYSNCCLLVPTRGVSRTETCLPSSLMFYHFLSATLGELDILKVIKHRVLNQLRLCIVVIDKKLRDNRQKPVHGGSLYFLIMEQTQECHILIIV